MSDPVLLELLWTRLVPVVGEAVVTLARSSSSTVVREGHGFGAAPDHPEAHR